MKNQLNLFLTQVVFFIILSVEGAIGPANNCDVDYRFQQLNCYYNKLFFFSFLLILLTFCFRFYEVRVETCSTDYYNAMLLRKHPAIEATEKLKYAYFENSEMERHYLLQKITISGFPVILMTSHLESLKEYADQRQSQLRECFNA